MSQPNKHCEVIICLILEMSIFLFLLIYPDKVHKLSLKKAPDQIPSFNCVALLKSKGFPKKLEKEILPDGNLSLKYPLRWVFKFA